MDLHSWSYKLSWHSMLSLPLEQRKAKEPHSPVHIITKPLASGVCQPAGHSADMPAQASVPPCMLLMGVSNTIHPVPCPSAGCSDTQKCGKLFLSAAKGIEQKVLFSCVPAHLLPPHTSYRWGLGGCDKAGGVPNVAIPIAACFQESAEKSLRVEGYFCQGEGGGRATFPE